MARSVHTIRPHARTHTPKHTHAQHTHTHSDSDSLSFHLRGEPKVIKDLRCQLRAAPSVFICAPPPELKVRWHQLIQNTARLVKLSWGFWGSTRILLETPRLSDRDAADENVVPEDQNCGSARSGWPQQAAVGKAHSTRSENSSLRGQPNPEVGERSAEARQI